MQTVIWNSTLDLLDDKEWEEIIQSAYQYTKGEEDVTIPDATGDGGASSGTEDFILLSDSTSSDIDNNA
ncbi:hypothetical protein PHLGIDRAFT_122516 [Phlebiopsis gigantea 11061_1 CR5-6]|uniref:Uncharacterized protein n=1 Tax=Phlebiopsis gigantea (strain 11061_1 CR5-6) TaxID=745531 RepID=A0A0C3S3G2_PHLG1|nr:hypothetical protein PHLGIDRAFT_122516 [Phlebiopsis gigantea 11061_1 CR5-6]